MTSTTTVPTTTTTMSTSTTSTSSILTPSLMGPIVHSGVHGSSRPPGVQGSEASVLETMHWLEVRVELASSYMNDRLEELLSSLTDDVDETPFIKLAILSEMKVI